MSMTTELAQRMKAAAIRAKAATEDYVANRMSMSVCLSECEEFNNLSDGPDNIIALVEALEAKDKQIAELIGIISSARKFTSKCAGFGDIGAAEFSKIIDRASGVAVEGE